MTVTQTSMPAESSRIIRLADEPWITEPVADAGVTGGDHERLSVDSKSDVADETLVEDGVDCFAVENAALWEAAETGPFGDVDIVGHLC